MFPTIPSRIQRLVLACVLPLWVLAMVLAFLSHRREVRGEVEGAVRIAQSTMQAVEADLALQISTLQTLATSPSIDDRDYPRLLDQATRVNEFSAALNIFLVQTDMQVLMSLDSVVGQALPRLASDRMPEVLARRQPAVSNLFIGSFEKFPLVSVGVPVVRGERLIGRLQMVFRPERIAKVLSTRPRPAAWSIVVFDREGVVIASSNPAAGRLGQPVSAELLAASAQRAQGDLHPAAQTGDPMTLAFSRSALYGWTAAVAVPDTPLDAALRRTWVAQAAGAAALLLVGLAMGRVIGRRIGQPIQSLVQAARAIGQGELTAVSEDTSLRETHELARALNEARELLAAREAARQKAEALQWESQSRLDLTLQATQVGDWALDVRTGHFLHSASHDRCHGHEPPVPGWRLAQFRDQVHADDRAGLKAAISAGCAERRVWQHDFRVWWPDGSLHWLSASGTHEIENGVVIRELGIVIDITERKRSEALRIDNLRLELANRQIVESDRLKSAFLANMSHELRTPLNAVIGFADVLQSGVVTPGSPQHGKYLGFIASSGRHLLRLINDVLDLSKVEAGKLTFNPQDVQIEPLVADVTSLMAPQFDAKGLTLAIDVPGGLGSFWLDPARLRQVLDNLLSNALKFTPAGGRVTLRVRADGPQGLRIDVEDTGVGIAADDIGRLFMPFQRVGEARMPLQPGTGLGLALTRQLVERQGGSVGVRSTLGEGSVFYVVLPCRCDGVAEAAP